MRHTHTQSETDGGGGYMGSIRQSCEIDETAQFNNNYMTNDHVTLIVHIGCRGRVHFTSGLTSLSLASMSAPALMRCSARGR